ncbi:SH3 domain protein [Pseudomonas sp. TE3786]
MRQGPLSLLFAASLLIGSTPLLAEEPPVVAAGESTASAEQTQLQQEVDSLEQRLGESERLRAELTTQLQSSAEVRENAVIGRLRQENQRLKLQLKEAQASQQAPLLSEEQSWFAIGAAVTLVALFCGALLRGGRKGRREWIN